MFSDLSNVSSCGSNQINYQTSMEYFLYDYIQQYDMWQNKKNEIIMRNLGNSKF